MDCNAIKWADVLLKYLSNDIYNIFVGYIVSKILTKNRYLLTLVLNGKEAPLYAKDIYRPVYPQYKSYPECGE